MEWFAFINQLLKQFFPILITKKIVIPKVNKWTAVLYKIIKIRVWKNATFAFVYTERALTYATTRKKPDAVIKIILVFFSVLNDELFYFFCSWRNTILLLEFLDFLINLLYYFSLNIAVVYVVIGHLMNH